MEVENPVDKRIGNEEVNFNEIIILWMKQSIRRVFGLKESEPEVKWGGNSEGPFKITFRYAPKDFTIVVDRDARYRIYDIFITDEEGATNSLYRMTGVRSELTRENIDAAFDRLKTVVDNENILLYIFKDGKVYRKTKYGPRRLKNTNEMLTDGATIPEKYL